MTRAPAAQHPSPLVATPGRTQPSRASLSVDRPAPPLGTRYARQGCAGLLVCDSGDGRWTKQPRHRSSWSGRTSRRCWPASRLRCHLRRTSNWSVPPLARLHGWSVGRSLEPQSHSRGPVSACLMTCQPQRTPNSIYSHAGALRRFDSVGGRSAARAKIAGGKRAACTALPALKAMSTNERRTERGIER